MSRTVTSPTISQELLIQQHGQGMRLVRPDNRIKGHHCLYSVKDMLDLPINSYFTNNISEIQLLNEPSAASCGFISTTDATSRTIADVAIKGTENEVFKHDKQVRDTQKALLTEESYTRKNMTDMIAISLKLPWYDSNNNVLGVFGFSILNEDNSISTLAKSFSILHETGLISTSFRKRSPFINKHNLHDIYLTNKQIEILTYLRQGNTAKKIGKIMHLSFRTIEHHLEKLKLITHTNSKAELISWAIENLE